MTLQIICHGTEFQRTDGLDAARTASIQCYEISSPRCPDYGWQATEAGFELYAGGETTGVLIREYAGAALAALPADIKRD